MILRQLRCYEIAFDARYVALYTYNMSELRFSKLVIEGWRQFDSVDIDIHPQLRARPERVERLGHS